MVNFYNTTAVIVDDTDPDIYYNGAWNHKHDVANDLGAYNSSWTDAFGAGLSATYTFEGTAVDVYGAVGSYDVDGVPSVSYSIDGGSPTIYRADVIPPGQFQTRQLFYNSPILPAGRHSLVITTLNETADFVLDFLVYTPVMNASTTATGSMASATLEASSGAVTPSQMPRSTSVLSTSRGHGATAAIAGGVAAGMAVLSACLIAFLCLLRRSRRNSADRAGPLPKSKVNLQSEMPLLPTTLVPYRERFPSTVALSSSDHSMISSRPPSAAGHTLLDIHNTLSPATPTFSRPSSRSSQTPTDAYREPHTAASAPPASQGPRKRPPREPTVDARLLPVHRDAGIRLVVGDESVAPSELPPAYQQYGH